MLQNSSSANFIVVSKQGITPYITQLDTFLKCHYRNSLHAGQQRKDLYVTDAITHQADPITVTSCRQISVQQKFEKMKTAINN